MVATVVPPALVLPDVLPTDRLSSAGRPAPSLREQLRRIPDRRNILTVFGAWLQSFGVVAAAAWLDRWWAYAVAFFLLGRGFAVLNILGHEAAHRLLFSRRTPNDVVGRWMLSYPAFTPFDLYRRSHMAHHRDELGPEEPDIALYSGYPITRASMRRKLTRDAVGISGWKNLKPLLMALSSRSSRPIASRIVGVQIVLWAAFWLASGRWWLYPLLWLAPWMSVWRVINRLRVIAEHAGMERSEDRRKTTHVVRQRPLARFWMVPYNTGWHLAHHVDMGIPWRNLPALHAELVAAGWITPELEYPSYLALWRALASRR
ncbi:MAG TPA: fatty acid desaturase family protein [Acidimicrobiales bacterium]